MCKLMRTIRQALSPIQKNQIQESRVVRSSPFLYTVALKCSLFNDASGSQMKGIES